MEFFMNKIILIRLSIFLISFNSFILPKVPDFFPFFTKNIDNRVFLKALEENLPELRYLRDVMHGTPEGSAKAHAKSPSMLLVGKQFIEYDRTMVSLLILKWVLTGDYDALVNNQKPELRMTQEQFKNLQNYTKKILNIHDINALSQDSIDRLAALIIFIAINDLGKNVMIAKTIERELGQKSMDHDMVLYYFLQKYPDRVPAYQKLPNAWKQTILNGLKADFNFPQFVQAESIAANLNKLEQLSAQELAFLNAHALFDLAGAAGHVNPEGSLVLTRPTYEGIELAIDALNAHVGNPLEMYNSYLNNRARALGFAITNEKDKAFVRLAFMLRAQNKAEIENLKALFEQLDPQVQTSLITELNKTGFGTAQPAIVQYYAPAFLVNARQNHKDAGAKKALELMNIVFQKTLQQVKQKGIRLPVVTVEIKDLAEAIKKPDALSLSSDNIEVVVEGDRGEARIVK